jgi:hypothetical protein
MLAWLKSKEDAVRPSEDINPIPEPA